MIFDWDDEKADRNLAKHGVSFAEAQTVFDDPLGRIMDDPDHGSHEHRELIFGRSAYERLLLISFTHRGEATRIISARKASNQERRRYEEETI